MRELNLRQGRITPIPMVMTDAVAYLDCFGLEVEGIFRKSGSVSLVEYFKEQYDQGEQNKTKLEQQTTRTGGLKGEVEFRRWERKKERKIRDTAQKRQAFDPTLLLTFLPTLPVRFECVLENVPRPTHCRRAAQVVFAGVARASAHI